MSDPVVEKEEVTSYLDMSDEDMASLDLSTVNPPAQAEEELEEVEEVSEEAETSEASEDSTDSEDSDEKEEASEEVGEETTPEETKEVTEVTDKEPAKETPAEVKADTVDYKAEYEKLMTPFKANGREIAVSNMDDAIALMQMGANYSKKMAALKPNLKLMKLLENNGLLNEEKLGFLIDLEKKNPEAISKLVKDSGLDPLDLDAEKASGYKPNTYTVDDREMELDTVLDELQGSPAYNRTLDIVSNKWDGPSKQVIANSPQLLRVINDHVQSGIYDTILKEVEKERLFGRLTGLSDIEAYRQIGDAIQARGGFAPVGNQGQQVPAKPVVVVPKPKSADDDKLKDKKRAASSSKPAASINTAKEFNPLAMSDEEFSKVNPKYL